jgi:hypothetical protein
MRDELIIDFATLLRVELRHLYYTSGLAENIAARPTPECARMLQKFGLLFRATAEGFCLFQQVERAEAGALRPLKPLPAGARLGFLLTARHNDLLGCSDLPLAPEPDPIYCFHNLRANTQEGRLLLSGDTGSPYVTADDRLPLKPLQFATTVASDAPQVAFALSDAWGAPIDNRAIAVTAGRARYSVDLRLRGEGRYGLSVDGRPAQAFYAAPQSHFEGRTFGIIEIHHRPEVPADYALIDPDDGRLTPRTYTLIINNRRTRWRYYFVHKYRMTQMTPQNWPRSWPADWPTSMPATWPPDWPAAWPRDYAVSYPLNGDVRLRPLPAAAKAMPDGALAIPFVSDQALPLQQQPPKGIALRHTGGNGGGSGIQEMENLPAPAVSALVPAETGEELFSEVYVYL